MAKIDLLDVANKAIQALNCVTLTCRKCSRQDLYDGRTPTECLRKALEAGWIDEELDGETRALCPACSGSTVPQALAGLRKIDNVLAHRESLEEQ